MTIEEELSIRYERAVLEKAIEALAHGDDDFDYSNFYYFPALFDYLESYIMKNHQEHFLFDDAKKNLLHVIGYLRFDHQYSSEEERVKRFQWCNQLIGLLNKSTSENSTVYYTQQFRERFHVDDTITLSALEVCLPYIYKSIMDDTMLLESIDIRHNFYDQYYEFFLYNPNISNNIGILIKEYPNIYDAEDIQKLKSVLVGQHSLASSVDLSKLVIYGSENMKYEYPVDQEAYEILKRGIHLDHVVWLIEQLTNINAPSTSPLSGDIDNNDCEKEKTK